MSPNGEEEKMLLGFLTLIGTASQNGYIGAILITDVQGIPQEFRCTHPVKPTAIQKPLYGDALEPFIGINLCGVPLIKKIENRPTVIVVNRDYLMAIRDDTSPPVIFIRRAGQAIDIKNHEGAIEKKRRIRVECGTGRFQPIILESKPDYEDDITTAMGILENIFNYFDLLEPFDRITQAIQLLVKQDKRFQ